MIAQSVPKRSHGVPQQAAAIAIRRNGRSLEVCLIRRRESKTWGIPKGFVDAGDTHRTTALNEAWEEAGLRGRLLGRPIGTYEYKKWKSRFAVLVYVMEVLEQKDKWDEMDFRDRRWVSFRKATELLTKHPVHPLLDRANKRVVRKRQRKA